MDFASTEDTSANNSSGDGNEESESLDKFRYFNATKKGKS